MRASQGNGVRYRNRLVQYRQTFFCVTDTIRKRMFHNHPRIVNDRLLRNPHPLPVQDGTPVCRLPEAHGVQVLDVCGPYERVVVIRRDWYALLRGGSTALARVVVVGAAAHDEAEREHGDKQRHELACPHNPSPLLMRHHLTLPAAGDPPPPYQLWVCHV